MSYLCCWCCERRQKRIINHYLSSSSSSSLLWSLLQGSLRIINDKSYSSSLSINMQCILIIMQTLQMSKYAFSSARLATKGGLYILAQIHRLSSFTYLLFLKDNDRLTIFCFLIIQIILFSIILYVIVVCIWSEQSFRRNCYLHLFLNHFIISYQYIFAIPFIDISLGIISCNSHGLLHQFRESCDLPLISFLWTSLGIISIIISYSLILFSMFLLRNSRFIEKNKLKRQFSNEQLLSSISLLLLQIIYYLGSTQEDHWIYIFKVVVTVIMCLSMITDVIMNYPFLDNTIGTFHIVSVSIFSATNLTLLAMSNDSNHLWNLPEKDAFCVILMLSVLMSFTFKAIQISQFRDFTKDIMISRQQHPKKMTQKGIQILTAKCQDIGKLFQEKNYCRIEEKIEAQCLITLYSSNAQLREYILEQSLSSSYGEHNSSQSDLSFNKIFSNSKLIEGIFLESLDLFERQNSRVDSLKEQLFLNYITYLINKEDSNLLHAYCELKTCRWKYSFIKTSIYFTAFLRILAENIESTLNSNKSYGQQQFSVFQQKSILVHHNSNNTQNSHSKIGSKLSQEDYEGQLFQKRNNESLNAPMMLSSLKTTTSTLSQAGAIGGIIPSTSPLTIDEMLHTIQIQQFILPLFIDLLNKKIDFWLFLKSKDQKQENSLFQCTRQLYAAFKGLRNVFKQEITPMLLNGMIQQNAVLLKLALIYRVIVYNEIKLPTEYHQQLQRLYSDHNQHSKHSPNNNSFNSVNLLEGRIQILQTTIQHDQVYILSKPTPETAKFFGYTLDEFKLVQNANVLMPKHIAFIHHLLVHTAINTSQSSRCWDIHSNLIPIQCASSNSNDTPNDTFGTNKQGYIFPMRIQLNFALGVSGDLRVNVSLLKLSQNDGKHCNNINTQTQYVLFNQYGCIQGSTEYLALLISGLKEQQSEINKNQSRKNILHQQTMNAFLIFAELGQIIRDYFARQQKQQTEYHKQIDILCDQCQALQQLNQQTDQKYYEHTKTFKEASMTKKTQIFTNKQIGLFCEYQQLHKHNNKPLTIEPQQASLENNNSQSSLLNVLHTAIKNAQLELQAKNSIIKTIGLGSLSFREINYHCNKEGINKADIIFELTIRLVEHQTDQDNLSIINADDYVTSNTHNIQNPCNQNYVITTQQISARQSQTKPINQPFQAASAGFQLTKGVDKLLITQNIDHINIHSNHKDVNKIDSLNLKENPLLMQLSHSSSRVNSSKVICILMCFYVLLTAGVHVQFTSLYLYLCQLEERQINYEKFYHLSIAYSNQTISSIIAYRNILPTYSHGINPTVFSSEQCYAIATEYNINFFPSISLIAHAHFDGINLSIFSSHLKQSCLQVGIMEMYLKHVYTIRKVCEGSRISKDNSKLFDLNSLLYLVSNYFTNRESGLKMMVASMLQQRELEIEFTTKIILVSILLCIGLLGLLPITIPSLKTIIRYQTLIFSILRRMTHSEVDNQIKLFRYFIESLQHPSESCMLKDFIDYPQQLHEKQFKSKSTTGKRNTVKHGRKYNSAQYLDQSFTNSDDGTHKHNKNLRIQNQPCINRKVDSLKDCQQQQQLSKNQFFSGFKVTNILRTNNLGGITYAPFHQAISSLSTQPTQFALKTQQPNLTSNQDHQSPQQKWLWQGEKISIRRYCLFLIILIISGCILVISLGFYEFTAISEQRNPVDMIKTSILTLSTLHSGIIALQLQRTIEGINDVEILHCHPYQRIQQIQQCIRQLKIFSNFMSNQIASKDTLINQQQHQELKKVLYEDLNYQNKYNTNDKLMKMKDSEDIGYADKYDSSQNNRIAIHHDYYQRIKRELNKNDDKYPEIDIQDNFRVFYQRGLLTLTSEYRMFFNNYLEQANSSFPKQQESFSSYQIDQYYALIVESLYTPSHAFLRIKHLADEVFLQLIKYQRLVLLWIAILSSILILLSCLIAGIYLSQLINTDINAARFTLTCMSRSHSNQKTTIHLLKQINSL